MLDSQKTHEAESSPVVLRIPSVVKLGWKEIGLGISAVVGVVGVAFGFGFGVGAGWNYVSDDRYRQLADTASKLQRTEIGVATYRVVLCSSVALGEERKPADACARYSKHIVARQYNSRTIGYSPTAILQLSDLKNYDMEAQRHMENPDALPDDAEVISLWSEAISGDKKEQISASFAHWNGRSVEIYVDDVPRPTSPEGAYQVLAIHILFKRVAPEKQS